MRRSFMSKFLDAYTNRTFRRCCYENCERNAIQVDISLSDGNIFIPTCLAPYLDKVIPIIYKGYEHITGYLHTICKAPNTRYTKFQDIIYKDDDAWGNSFPSCVRKYVIGDDTYYIGSGIILIKYCSIYIPVVMLGINYPYTKEDNRYAAIIPTIYINNQYYGKPEVKSLIDKIIREHHKTFNGFFSYREINFSYANTSIIEGSNNLCRTLVNFSVTTNNDRGIIYPQSSLKTILKEKVTLSNYNILNTYYAWDTNLEESNTNRSATSTENISEIPVEQGVLERTEPLDFAEAASIQRAAVLSRETAEALRTSFINQVAVNTTTAGAISNAENTSYPLNTSPEE